MTDKVIKLPCKATVDEVLDQAKAEQYDQVVVIGYKDDRVFQKSANANIDRVVYLHEVAKILAIGQTIGDEP